MIVRARAPHVIRPGDDRGVARGVERALRPALAAREISGVGVGTAAALAVTMRFLSFAAPSALIAILISLSSAARAEELAPTSRSPGTPGLSLSVGSDISAVGKTLYGTIAFGSTYRFGPHVSLGLGVAYGFNAFQSLCAVDSFGPPGVPTIPQAYACGPIDHYLRVAVEPRYAFVLGRAAELWVGAAAGVADAIELPYAGAVSHHAGPLLGVASGIDLYAGRLVSFGFQLGADAVAFGASPLYNAEQPSGLSMTMHLGLALAVHLPM